MADDSNAITLEKRGKIAVVTLNRENKLNALNQDLYYRLATVLNDIASMDDIYIAVLTGKGRFFSAGADVSLSRETPTNEDIRRHWLKSFVANNLYITRIFYTFPKILITALNGPAVGLSAALIAWSDFIYAAPHAYLLTPFTSLGLVAEGGASIGFVQRLGISKANEALIMSKKIGVEDMKQTGFVNGVIEGCGDGKSFDSDKFLGEVLREVEDRLGPHLNSESLVGIKKLIRAPSMDSIERQGVLEVVGGLERFVRGIPQEEFKKIASGQKRHKL